MHNFTNKNFIQIERKGANNLYFYDGLAMTHRAWTTLSVYIRKQWKDFPEPLTIEEIQKAKPSLRQLSKTRNCGKKTINELIEVLGPKELLQP